MAKDSKKDDLPGWANSSPWFIGRGNVTAEANKLTDEEKLALEKFVRLRGEGDKIGELVDGSRGRTKKWKWNNKNSPFLPQITRLVEKRKDRQPELHYRWIKFPEMRSKGSTATGNKADPTLKRVLCLKEILQKQEMLFDRELVTAILNRWNDHYPHTDTPSRRTISRHAKGR